MEIEMYCSSPSKREAGTSVWNGVPVRVFRRQRAFPYWPHGFLEAINEVKRSRSFDLIHIHGVRTLEPLLTAFGNRDGVPYYITPHFHPKASNVFLSLIKRLYDPFIVSRLLASSKKIICVSETEERFLLRSFGKNLRSKIQLAPNGVDRTKFKRNPTKLSQNRVTLLFVGRLEKYKNVDVAIKVAGKLGDGYVLRIIGDGPYKQQLQRLVGSLGLQNVIFHGVLNDEELYEHFYNCDILINFSEIEAFGISVLEAIAAGKPAVVNNKLGLQELARKFPSAVFSVDVEKMCLTKIAQQIEYALYAEVDVDLSEYTWEQVASKMARLYSEAATN
jgi:glycosyltransferase involved in cell wall biosynthesis